MTRRISLKVFGRVQGVGYRYFTRKLANSYGITGYVKNTSDNAVIIEAKGSDLAIQYFLKNLSKGPSTAKVEKIEHQSCDDPLNYDEFEIIN